MRIIDRYAYNNHIRTVEPGYKAGLALTVILLCLLLNKPQVGLVAASGMFLLAVGLAGIPVRTFGRVLLAEVTFLALTTVGVVLSVSFSDPGNISTWAWQVGPFWFSSSPKALYQGVILVTRAFGAASAMNFLALTTPLIDMIELLRRWHVPVILIDIMTVIYRFIFVLLDTLNRIYMAQDSRLGYHTSYFRAMNNAALLGSRLFIDAFHRSQRLQIALESRGYDGGDMRVVSSHYKSDSKIIWLGLVVVMAMVLVWVMI